MTLYITQIGQQRLVCGLFWQSLSRPRELEQEARALARKIDFDLMVLRTEHSCAQAGYAQARDGARRAMVSLAAAVCKAVAADGAYYEGRQQRAHNWLGAFKLPDGMWAYFAVRDGNLLPNGDFAGSKEQVLERLHGDYGLGGWNVVIGDAELAEYDFHNFNARPIEELLALGKGGKIRLQSGWRLRQVERRLARPALALALLALALGGIAYWQFEQRRQAAEQERAFAAARQAVLAQAAAVPHPWASQPPPRQLVQACLDGFAHLNVGGWQLDEYVCGAASQRYGWTRRDASVGYLLAQVPDAVVELDGNRAAYARALPARPGPRQDEALLEPRQLIEPLMAGLQQIGLAPLIARQAPPSAPPGPDGQPPPAPPWQRYSLLLNGGGVPPMELAGLLSRPGVRIEQVIYRAGAWSIEGVMYAK
ncbi:type 4b pilus protein PilO2 [Oxalobacteraceae bacterium]|nr:type 4b pilus protein PilO2 [Oxalobacteraceae bacterium]